MDRWVDRQRNRRRDRGREGGQTDRLTVELREGGWMDRYCRWKGGWRWMGGISLISGYLQFPTKRN